MICDRDGVPKLIQRMAYLYGGMYFVVDFFNGRSKRFVAEQLCPSIGLCQEVPTPMQWLEAENTVELLVLKYYRKMFPEFSLRVVK
jgi:hypothetical protein